MFDVTLRIPVIKMINLITDDDGADSGIPSDFVSDSCEGKVRQKVSQEVKFYQGFQFFSLHFHYFIAFGHSKSVSTMMNILKPTSIVRVPLPSHQFDEGLQKEMFGYIETCRHSVDRLVELFIRAIIS